MAVFGLQDRLTERQGFELGGDGVLEVVVDPVDEAAVLAGRLYVDVGFGAVWAVGELELDVGASGVLLGGLGYVGHGVGNPDAVLREGVAAVASSVAAVAFSMTVCRAAFAVTGPIVSVAAMVLSVVRHLDRYMDVKKAFFEASQCSREKSEDDSDLAQQSNRSPFEFDICIAYTYVDT